MGKLAGKSESGIQDCKCWIRHVQVAWKAPGEVPQPAGLWDWGQEMFLGQADISSELTLYRVGVLEIVQAFFMVV